MTPITEDQVLTLMKGLETREKRAMKRLSDAVSGQKRFPGQATARILSFGRPVSPGLKKLVSADVVALDKERSAQAERRTRDGRFLFAVPTKPR